MTQEMFELIKKVATICVPIMGVVESFRGHTIVQKVLLGFTYAFIYGIYVLCILWLCSMVVV